ncbi:MAG TPA: substrate-binding domain-containing protein [Caulobacteraceae bacterium]|nr:substrate-binding domain-containing protein [Caulobacteraceae bacterium]
MSSGLYGISSMATRLILGELALRYQATSGIPVEMKSMGGVDAARLVREGEAADIVVLASNVMAQLEAEGRILPGSIRPFARSGMAIAVAAGAPWPDIGDEAAVRRAVGAAGRVGYSTGPSGDHLLQLVERWGLGDAKSERLVKAPPGVPVALLVARGDADLGFQQLSELIDAPGIEVVGPLPPEIQATTIFAAGVCSASPRPAEAAHLIAYLTSPAADEVVRSQGMEPASAA